MKKVMKAVAALMLMTAVVFAAGCQKTDDTNNGDNNDADPQNHHEYVDLGLPSGTLWATCNVGADTPEAYGNFFAWGETKTKKEFNWGTYTLCNGNSDSFTKYTYSDGLTVLEPIDDAATANWGDKWCMPSTLQLEELFEKASYKWTKQNGVCGVLFTANNGKSLFLPAAGSGYDCGTGPAGECGVYWANSLDPNSDVIAMRMSFVNDAEGFRIGMGSNRRRYGFSIRPVRSTE